MSAVYLIDGYNLIHALGILHGRTGPGGLEKARLGLLGLLRGACGDRSSAITVVFDAAGAPPGALGREEYRGLHVRYAIGHAEADDLIELLIDESSAPKDLTVISDDHRLQQAARRRHAHVMGCAGFLDWLDAQRRRNRPAPSDGVEKRTPTSPEETRKWLAEFGDLEHDPAWKELFDAWDFEVKETD